MEGKGREPDIPSGYASVRELSRHSVVGAVAKAGAKATSEEGAGATFEDARDPRRRRKLIRGRCIT